MMFNKELGLGFICFFSGIAGTILMFSIHASFLIMSFVGFFISGVYFWLSQLANPLDEIPNGSEYTIHTHDNVEVKP